MTAKKFLLHLCSQSQKLWLGLLTLYESLSFLMVTKNLLSHFYSQNQKLWLRHFDILLFHTSSSSQLRKSFYCVCENNSEIDNFNFVKPYDVPPSLRWKIFITFLESVSKMWFHLSDTLLSLSLIMKKNSLLHFGVNVENHNINILTSYNLVLYYWDKKDFITISKISVKNYHFNFSNLTTAVPYNDKLFCIAFL